MIQFSIIIPHKNTPLLLRRCLDSIPRREDIQIIVVDDNSSQDQVDFEHFPGLNDPYVEIVFTKEGKGAGYARNIGLSKAKGKWLLFADADDFFTENAFGYLFDYIDSPHDIVFFQAVSCHSETYEPANRANRYNRLVDNFLKNVIDAEDTLRFTWWVPWGKMIRAEFIQKENILFDEVIASNDVMFSAITGFFAKSIDAVDCVIYCITSRMGSLIKTKSAEYLTSRYIVRLWYNAFLKKINKKHFQFANIRYLYLSLVNYGAKLFFNFFYLAIIYHDNLFSAKNRLILKKAFFEKTKS
ncbi:glycosyltransferase family 2 protein [Treponema primitia]|uniref:glycosyltransferase family 2 protein n=1 Tax=Treponema primitia TaxID=88058 RepID=UPI0002554EDC|nr:glycosyltransferase family 2 protein [Treponema primitia]